MSNIFQRIGNFLTSLWRGSDANTNTNSDSPSRVDTFNQVESKVAEPIVLTEPATRVEPELFSFSSKKGADVVMAHVMDITTFEGGAIVNAANQQLDAGGGVCGAIFRASDMVMLQKACHNYPEDGSGVRCPTGDAKITPSFGMAAPWIIHAVGPIWKGGLEQESELLASAYRQSLEVAYQNNIRSIAFPAISTGIYGFPLNDATEIAVSTIYSYVREYPDRFDHIEFTCFNADILAVYEGAMHKAQFNESPDSVLNEL